MKTSPSKDLLARGGYLDFEDAVKKLDTEADIQAKQWLESGKRIGLFTAAFWSIAAFRKTYGRDGYSREGVTGLFLSVHDGMRIFLSYAKYWEIKTASSRPGIPV